MIEVETPDGGVAEFPDGTAPDIIKAALRKKFPAPQTVADGKGDRERSMGSTLADAGMSAAQGIGNGLQGLMGGIGDAQELVGGAASWGAGKLGAGPEMQGMVGEVARRLPTFGARMPTTQEIGQVVNPVVGSYSPETTAGRYAKTVGEFAPAALAGPGGAVRKTAMAVIPGVATSLVGDLTKQNPMAKAGAGIVTGVLTAGRGGAAGTKSLLGEVGNVEKKYAEVKGAADQAYGALRSAGVKYDANVVDQVIADVSGMRLNDKLSPKAVGLREELAKFQGKGMDYQDLDELERISTGILRDKIDNTDKKFVGDILDKIKGIRQGGAIATNGSVPADEVNSLIGTAKDFGRRKILADNITEMKRRLPGYLAGDESAFRNQFGSYLKSPAAKSLAPAEKQAFGAVVRREGPLNVAHNLGSRMGQIAGGSTGAGVGALLGSSLGPVGTIVGGLAGAGVSMGVQSLFRKVMEVATEKGVDNALKTVLAGRSAQEKAAVLDLLAKNQARVGGLLSADAAIQSNMPPQSAGLLGVPR